MYLLTLKMQFVFLWLLHDDSNLHQGKKLEYKHAYISRYVQPNMVINVFNNMCKTPLYKTKGLNFFKWVDLYFFIKMVEEMKEKTT